VTFEIDQFVARRTSAVLSVIICTKDDHEAFRKTLESLRGIPSDFFEVIVSDSSSHPEISKQIITEVGLRASVSYCWSEPQGVFPGINAALPHARGRWIHVLHSGDLLLSESVDPLIEALESSTADILVFHIVYMRSGEYVYFKKISQDSMTLPHQATFVRSYVHEEIGLYDERYKFAADQVFLHAARTRFRVKVLEPVVVAFDISGLSSKLKWRVMREASALYKLYGYGPFKRLFHAYAFQIFRRFTTDLISPKVMDLYSRRRHRPVPEFLRKP